MPERGSSLVQETTRWERRLVEAWRDHELLGWDVDGPGDPESSGDRGGLTQEVVAMLCAEEEVASRREELERSGELKAVRAVRDYVQVGDVSLLAGMGMCVVSAITPFHEMDLCAVVLSPLLCM